MFDVGERVEVKVKQTWRPATIAQVFSAMSVEVKFTNGKQRVVSVNAVPIRRVGVD